MKRGTSRFPPNHLRIKTEDILVAPQAPTLQPSKSLVAGESEVVETMFEFQGENF
jgi:hypothetical protein